MIVDRYPTPLADRYFDRQTQIDSWTEITRYYATKDAADNGITGAFNHLREMQTPPAQSVATREAVTGHEVVAFLQLLEEQNPSIKQHLHVGLTSSDLVEYALSVATESHARAMVNYIDTLIFALRNSAEDTRLSRTHGQVGWLTTLRKQFAPTANALVGISADLTRWANVRPLKTSGPSGAYSVVGYRTVGVAAVINRKATPSTQILHRDHLLAWAALYLRIQCTLENLALQIRLGSRSDVGEIREGAAAHRAGSSAMPHKRNPIDSERICGLTRIARGNFLALAEGVALWEERDLSNSAPERVAVPSMAETIEYSLTKMTNVIENLDVHPGAMQLNIDAHPEHQSHVVQYALQTRCGLGPVEASDFVKQHVAYRPDGQIDIDAQGWIYTFKGTGPAMSVAEFIQFCEETLQSVQP